MRLTLAPGMRGFRVAHAASVRSRREASPRVNIIERALLPMTNIFLGVSKYLLYFIQKIIWPWLLFSNG
jgi:hypothetical protein